MLTPSAEIIQLVSTFALGMSAPTFANRAGPALRSARNGLLLERHDLMAKTLHPHTLPIQQDRWYIKDEATFSDVLAAVRRHLWSAMNYTISPRNGPTCLIPTDIWNRIQNVLAYAA